MIRAKVWWNARPRMSVSHPGGDSSANLYAQLKRILWEIVENFLEDGRPISQDPNEES